MRVIKSVKEMQKTAEKLRNSGYRIAFVPTMGYLHDGHIALIKKARKLVARAKRSVVVVSIFVNPTQFAPGEDYERYPRDERRDIEICKREKVDIVFMPSVKEMYPDGFETFVEVRNLQNHLCGLFRPGHFRGVATVVTKLFNIVKPHVAVFGEKDYQQLLIIKRLVKDLNFDVKIVSHPTVRDRDGLALSSRNEYLSKEEREIALAIPRSLELAKRMIEGGEKDAEKVKKEAKRFLENAGVKVQYFEIVNPETLESVREIEGDCLVAVAGFVGKARLIDNVLVRKKG